jgi:hypothetical protein
LNPGSDFQAYKKASTHSEQATATQYGTNRPETTSHSTIVKDPRLPVKQNCDFVRDRASSGASKAAVVRLVYDAQLLAVVLIFDEVCEVVQLLCFDGVTYPEFSDRWSRHVH